MVLLLVLALAGPELSYRASGQTLVLAVDRSASVASARPEEARAVQSLVSTLPAKDELGVVSFGQDALVEGPPAQYPQFEGFVTSPGAGYTDIESALRLAGSLVVPGSRRHVLLFSDGRQNIGDAVGEAGVLRSQGVRVDVLPLQIHVGPDVRVDSVDAPATLPTGTRAQVSAVLVSNEATTVRVVWGVDSSSSVLRRALRVEPGITEVHTLLPVVSPGFHEVTVDISPERDSVRGNNVGEALFDVLGRQQVLVVAGEPGAGTNVAHALSAAGMSPTVVSPSQVPSAATGVARWQAVALVDVSAAELGYQRMEALATATRDLGVGLAAFGGPGTFGPGGLAGTSLEGALPIEMAVKNPEEESTVAVVLVLETVESTGGDVVMRSAVKQLVAKLSPQDLVGVTDGLKGLVVPLQRVGNGAKLEKEIADIKNFGDPPSYVPYLQIAARALEGHPGTTKDIVLMGDGDAVLPSATFVAGLVREGITLSGLGLAMNASPDDMVLMSIMAGEGKGRFYESSSISQIPSIFLVEARSELQPWIVRERFRVAAGAPSAALDGIGPYSLPPLDGYVAATPKPASQVVLSGPDGDPILAQWQYGVGKAAAWTSDTEGRWSAELLRSPLAGKLFAGIVASTLPLVADPALSLTAQVEGDAAQIVAEAAGTPSNASAVAHVVGPDGHGSEVPLAETGPGRFEGEIPTPEVGGYLMRVEVSAGGRVLHAATAGVAVAYSPELRFIGTDLGFLKQVARAGGGAVLSSATEALSEPLPPVDVTQPFSTWLLVLAALLLPLDVALRRLSLSRRELVLPNEP
jgi:hypothetical protein